MTHFRSSFVIPLGLACLFVGACAKKHVAVNPPPPPAVAPSNNSSPSTQTSARNTTPEPRPATPSTPKSDYPDKATRDRIDTLLARISDAYFDYDKASLRPDAVSTLEADSKELRDILKQYPSYKLVIEGYCDERGSEEYNIGLGDARAKSAKDYLVQVGIPSQQMSVISYGKDRPVCTDHTEACWQKNRRIHIIPASNQPG